MPELTANSFFEQIRGMIPDDVNVEPVADFKEFDRIQCEWYNEKQGNLTGYDCPKCKNRGNFQVIDNDGNKVMRDCDCMEARRFIIAMNEAGLGDLYEKCNFEDYKVTEQWQALDLKLSKEYAAKDGNPWLIFSGNPGTGKTMLCTAICKELAKRGRDIKFVSWVTLEAKLIQTKFKLNEQEEIMQSIGNADVLYIDDFLKITDEAKRAGKKPSADSLLYAFMIVDKRYQSGRRTIFSSEWMIDQIVGMDEALGSRIRQMTNGSKIMNKYESGRNYRMRGDS